MITEHQLAFKKGKIGGPQVAAALGLSPFQTPAGLAMELLGRAKPPEENATIRGGNIMKPAIAELYTNQTGKEIWPWEDTCVHNQFLWLISHPDYFINDPSADESGDVDADTLIEIKNVGSRQRFRWENGVPLHVVAQCVLLSMLTGVDKVEVVAYFGGADLEIYPLKITDKQREQLLTKVCLFWFDWIAKNQIPPVCDRDIELIKTLYSTSDNETELTATPAVMEDIEDYRTFKKQRNEIDRSVGTLEAKIRLVMGGTSALNNPDGTREFTYKQARKSRKTDWKAVGTEFLCHNEKLYNDAVKKYTTVKKGSRQFVDKYNYDKE